MRGSGSVSRPEARDFPRGALAWFTNPKGEDRFLWSEIEIQAAGDIYPGSVQRRPEPKEAK